MYFLTKYKYVSILWKFYAKNSHKIGQKFRKTLIVHYYMVAVLLLALSLWARTSGFFCPIMETDEGDWKVSIEESRMCHCPSMRKKNAYLAQNFLVAVVWQEIWKTLTESYKCPVYHNKLRKCHCPSMNLKKENA